MVSLPLARCSSASCRSPGELREMPVRGGSHWSNTLARALVSGAYAGGCGGGPLLCADLSLPFPLPLVLACLRVPLMLHSVCGHPFSKTAHCSW
eukprot:2291695-Pyramimonas_sp.AAC.1